MVSIIGSSEYYETNLDDEIFRPKEERTYFCYRHIHGARMLTCGFQTTDEYLFGKHREWFCKFRADRCMRKCNDCTKLYENCIETDECKENDDNDEEEKIDKKKSFFSMFSKKHENKEDDEKNNDNEEKSQIGEDSEQKSGEDSKKVPKKKFFSIFGHDAENFDEPKDETNSEVNPDPEASVQGSVHEDDTSKHESEEIKPKKKSFFSKKTKEKDPDHETSTTKWHDGTSDDELDDPKPKKKSFFSRFSKKDLTRDSDSEDERPTEQNSTVVSEGEDDNEESPKKEKKRSFFSKFSSRSNLDDKKEDHEESTISTANSIDTIDTIENEESTQEPKKKKSFFTRFKKDDTKSVDSEEAAQDDPETSVDNTETNGTISKKKKFFRFKKDSESKDKSVDADDEAPLEDVETLPENSPEPKKEKKKTFLVRQKKENSIDSTAEDKINGEAKEEASSSKMKKSLLKKKESAEIEKVSEEDKSKKIKKKFLVRNTTVPDEEDKIEPAESINGDEENTNPSEKENSKNKESKEKEVKKEKKSFFSKSTSKKKTEEPQLQLERQESVDLDTPDKSDVSVDEKKPKEEKKKKSFFSIFKKDHPEGDSEESPGKSEEVANGEPKPEPEPGTSRNGLPEADEVIQLSEHGEALETQSEEVGGLPDGEIPKDEEPKPKRERRKSFLGIFTKKEDSETVENEDLAETRSLDGSKRMSKRKSRENLHEDKEEKLKKKSKSKLDLSKKNKEDDTYKKKYFEDCKICFPKFKDCPNNCYDCYRRISEYNWFDHCILRHAVRMETKIHEEETIAFYLQAEFNKKMYFWFTAYDYTFYLEFIFSSGSIIINMVTNMEEYACRYFKCDYMVSWLDSNFQESLSFLGQEFWDWNVHTILADKAVDDKFFDKCKLVIKVSTY